MAEEKQFGCPVCGFTSDSEEKVRDHMEEATDKPHQEYEMKEADEEDT